jgi:hypothetical protein
MQTDQFLTKDLTKWKTYFGDAFAAPRDCIIEAACPGLLPELTKPVIAFMRSEKVQRTQPGRKMAPVREHTAH